MPRALALAAALLVACASAAQTPPAPPPRPTPAPLPPVPGPPAFARDTTGFGDLEDEIRASAVPVTFYLPQLAAAWDDALDARRYARADSIAVLAEQALARRLGTSPDSLTWPSVADWLAVGLLRGDVGTLDVLAEGGDWQTTATEWSPVDLWLFMSDPRQLLVAPHGVRRSTRSALSEDRALALGRLTANGADAEAVAAADLAIGWLIDLRWDDGTPSEAQDALNSRADRFLTRYPDGRFADFVRQTVRRRYRRRGALVGFVGFGVGRAAEGLGEATGGSIAGDIGGGLRYGPLFADLSIQGADLTLDRTVEAGGETLEAGDRLSFALLGIDVGPRLSILSLDVLPSLSGGLLVQSTSAPGEDEIQRSTYEPPNRLGWGYGLALEYTHRPQRSVTTWAVRLRAGRLMPQFSRGFEDAVPGRLGYVTLGLVSSTSVRSRVD